MRRKSLSFFWLNLLVLVALGLSPVGSVFAPRQVNASPLEQAMQAAGVRAPLSGPAIEVGHLVSGPQMIQGMDAAPPAERAVVADHRIPAWETRYNTVAGVNLMPPLAPPSGLSAVGADVNLGAFRSFNLGGIDSIRSVVGAPDGRVFAAINGVGLGMYSRQANGAYAWSVITITPGGLWSVSIVDLAISGDLLLVGTADEGISALNLAVGGWKHFTTANTDLPSNNIISLTGIPSASGYVEFFAGTSNGAWYYVQNPSWQATGLAFIGVSVNKVLQQYLPSGTRVIWYATSDQLWRYDGAWVRFQGMAACALDSANTMALDGQNGVWVSAYTVGPNRPTGAASPTSDPADLLVKPFASITEPAVSQNQPSVQVTEPAAPNARYSIGACRYSGGSWTRYSQATPGLPSDYVTDLRTDGDGRVWMSFAGYNGALGGAAVYDQGTWLIFKKQYGDPLLADDVASVGVAGESVWFGYSNLSSLTQYANNWARFTTSHTGGSGAVSSIFIDQAETYIGRASGIAFHNGATWISHGIPNLTTPISQMARLNNLWIGTRGNGIFEYDGSSFIPHTTVEGLASDDVRDLVVDRQFRLWAATAGGLALRTNGYWLNFTSANSPLTTNDLTAIRAGSDGRLWIGTNGEGVWVLDPNAEAGMEGAPPSPAWTQMTSAQGLISDTVYALAVEPNGAVWVGGPGGQARRDPVNGAWVKMGSLDTTSLSVDPSGRVWLGTNRGLWSYNGSSRQFVVGSSLMDSDTVAAVASDGRRTWVASDGNVQVRGDIIGPIGFFAPSVSSFSPAAGGADQIVTINGANFDERSLGYNTVSFGNLSDVYTNGMISSASTSQLGVQVPLMALSGPITVQAHRLNGISANSFTVLPVIRSLSPVCASLGSELTIEGSGFNSGNLGVYVRLGSGAWHFADAQNPTTLRYRIRPGDTDGPVSVRIGPAGTIITSAQSLTIDTPVIDQVGIQQAIQGLPLVWAKRTLVTLSMRSGRGLCPSRVDSGQLEFKLKDGSTHQDWLSYQPTGAGLTIGKTAPALGVAGGVNFVLWSQALSQPDFSINDFDGVRLHLFNGPVEVVTYDIPSSSFAFTFMAAQRKVLNVQVFSNFIAGDLFSNLFYRNAEKGLEHVARVYPQSDLSPYFGREQDRWMSWAWKTIGRTNPINLDNSDTFHDLQGQVEDIRSSINDNGGRYDKAMGVMYASLHTPGTPSGKATFDCSNLIGDCDQNSAVAFSFTDNLAGTWLQETIHTMHWVVDSSPNHDGTNKGHSRYDNLDDNGNCVPAITFRQALVDQVGYPARVVRLEYGKAPYQFLFADCTTGQMPASVMSYAPTQDDIAFLEPLDYMYVFNRTRNLFGRETVADLSTLPGGLARPGRLFDRPGAPQSHRELRLNGLITGVEPHTVSISLSYLDDPGGELTAPSPNGPYQLNFLDANGAVLAELPFAVGTSHTHGAPVHDFRFALRAAFPDNTARVAMLHEGAEIWSQVVSSGTPQVSLSSPVGNQSYNAVDPLPVTWAASDPDSNPLSFILEYSADDGVTWQTIATGLSGLAYDWTPAFVPVGISRMRITASDGFNTAQATSDAFYIQPVKPIAIIQSPVNGQVINEGGEISLVGEVFASESADPVQYDWYFDGNYAASGAYLYDHISEIGTHAIDLQVTANGLPSDIASITITVVPDFDHDGLSNAYEQANGINPLDRSDSAADPDGDGLSSLLEAQIGTSPGAPDSDGDTMNDGDELAHGSDPSNAGSLPSIAPVLQVGATTFGFIYRQGDPAPDAWSIWVTNGGGGTLNWTAQSSAAWLKIGALAGSAPGKLLVSADPTGLAPGVYNATLTVSAPDASAGSPKIIPVWIRVYDPNGEIPLLHSVFLPLVKR